MIKSYAKINLGLFINEKRADGFHNLETLFQQIDLYDELTIQSTQTGKIELHCDSPFCPADESNLAYKAAALLQTHCHSALGCTISLTKNIPSGAGLGGGSSNAATVLLALNSLWDCKIDNNQLMQLAAELGSDVPFFILGGLALGQGRGEILTPLQVNPEYYGVLILPSVHISTKWAYENLKFHLTNKEKNHKLADFVRNLNNKEEWKEYLVNDLEKVVYQKYSTFPNIIHSLYEQGAFYAAMSGSGSTLFGLFENKDKAYQAMLKQEKQTILFSPVYT